MIKQVRMGERGCGGVWVYRNIETFFCFQNSRNSERFTITAHLKCTSMICMSLQLKTSKNGVGKVA